MERDINRAGKRLFRSGRGRNRTQTRNHHRGRKLPVSGGLETVKGNREAANGGEVDSIEKGKFYVEPLKRKSERPE